MSRRRAQSPRRHALLAACLCGCALAFLSACRHLPAHKTFRPEDAIRQIATNRYAAIERISAARAIPIPAEFQALIQAALAADWVAVSNLYEGVRHRSQQYEGPVDPAVATVLWHPLHETYWSFKYLRDFGREASGAYCDAYYASLPGDSLVFTGSDAGRFLAGALAPLAGRSDLVFVSQNILADNSYMDYLQDTSGDRIWIPPQDRRNEAFRALVEEVQRDPTSVSGTTVEEGRVRVEGVAGVMAINAHLARMMVESNQPARRVFVDEAYVIPWMTPRLRPRGLLLELVPDDAPALSDEEVSADMTFWDDLHQRLMGARSFRDRPEARKAFCLLRTAIAGVYAHQRRYADAERAFLQALAWVPDDAQASFRLAVQVLAPQGRREEARARLEDLARRDPANRNYGRYIDRLRP